jgi:light-regulated signal transduction histidine kinase (bacteriophytochrome)
MPKQATPDDSSGVYLNSDSLHDLVSPINQVCTMVDMILKKYRGTLDEEAETLFGYIQNSTGRLQNLLTGLRTYTQILGSPRPCDHCDANVLLAGALASIQQAIERNHAVVTHDPLPGLYCDRSQMSYAFASMIDNSIKFRGDRTPEIHVSASADDDIWVFSVRDNGIGIDPRHRDRIFGVFKRIHNEAYPGAGMGLAIVKRIVERHGGRIWVESDLGRGATFYLALPKNDETGANQSVEECTDLHQSVA